MRKKTKLIMLAGAVVAGIGALCMVNKKLACDIDDDDLGINDIFSNCKDMFEEVPASMLSAIYKDRKKLYTSLGHMAYICYDEDGDFIKAKAIDEDEDTYVELYIHDGEIQWRLS